MLFLKNSHQRNKPIRLKLYRFVLLATLLFFTIITALKAQQLPIFTQYREAQNVLNPAFVSSDYILYGNNMSIGASYRTQFSGIKRSPKTQILRGGYIVENDLFFKPDMGVVVVNDQASAIGTTSIFGKIAALGGHDPRYGGFSVGLMGGMTRFNLNTTEIAWRETGDFVSGQNLNKIYADIGVGAFGYLSLSGKKDFTFGAGADNIVYGGLCIPQVLSPVLTFQNNSKDIDFQRYPHFYATAGYYKFVGKESFVEPSICLKYVKNVSPQIQVNLRYHLTHILWLGAGYANTQTLQAEAGFWIGENIGWKNQKIKICYAFDYGFGAAASVLGMAHEVHLVFVQPP